MYVDEPKWFEKETNKITGKIVNYDSSSAIKAFYLYEANETGFAPYDTAFIKENGEFSFNVATNKNGLYGLGVSAQNAITIYFDSLTKIQKVTINDLARLSSDYSGRKWGKWKHSRFYCWGKRNESIRE